MSAMSVLRQHREVERGQETDWCSVLRGGETGNWKLSSLVSVEHAQICKHPFCVRLEQAEFGHPICHHGNRPLTLREGGCGEGEDEDDDDGEDCADDL